MNEYKRKKSYGLNKVSAAPVTPQTALSTRGVSGAVNTNSSVQNRSSELQETSFSLSDLVLATTPVTEAKKQEATIARSSEETAESSAAAPSSAKTPKHPTEIGVEKQSGDGKEVNQAKSPKTSTPKAKKSRWSRAKRFSRTKGSRQDVQTSLSSLPTEIPTKRLTPFSNGTYQLVLVTTVEIFGKKIDLRTNNTFAMFSLFQQHFSFRALIFTNSRVVQRACRHFHLAYDSDYE